jgi:hypothetical protein
LTLTKDFVNNAGSVRRRGEMTVRGKLRDHNNARLLARAESGPLLE